MIYKRLTNVEREIIREQLTLGTSPSNIAVMLGRSRSTVSRELQRGGHGTEQGYRACIAHAGAQHAASSRRGGKRKLDRNVELWNVVATKLKLRWSPKQIEQYLVLTFSHEPTMRITAESIYTYVYVQAKGALKKVMIDYLRRSKPRRTARHVNRSGPRRGVIPEMISIERRPAEVEGRTVPGHWEGDLVLGAGNKSAIGTLVERSTRWAILVKLTTKDASAVRRAFAREMRRLPEELAKSLTYDQGKEMAQHQLFTKQTKIKVYFAHPHSPWERGTNENTNGLVRDFYPAGTDFNTVSRAQLKRVQQMLNERPRKTLNWQTPSQKFSELVALNT